MGSVRQTLDDAGAPAHVLRHGLVTMTRLSA
jgi:hypothetical protein